MNDVGRAAAATSLLLAAAAGQAFERTTTPRGMVRDHRGAPIAGAAVRLEVRSLQPERLFIDALRAALARHPLPVGRSGSEGQFALEVPPELVWIAAREGTWFAVVEREGYRPWREHLPLGLAGWLGSEVVLAPWSDEDRHRLPPRPPATALLAYRPATGERRWLADGGADVLALPLAPWPAGAAVPDPRRPHRPIAVDWQLVALRGDGLVAPLDGPGLPPRPLPREPWVAASPRMAGAPAQAVRGLFRCPDGVARWLPAGPDARLAEHAHLSLLAWTAAGCGVSARGRPLQPLPPAPAPRVQVVGRDGTVPSGALAQLLPLASTLALDDAFPVLPAACREPRVPGSDGWLRLDGVPGDGSVALLVHAPGCAAELVLDPRLLREDEPIVLQPRPGGALDLAVRDDRGRPLADARVILSDSCDSPASRCGQVLRSGGDGLVTVEGIRPGSHHLFAWLGGRSCATLSFTVGEDGRCQGEVELPVAGDRRWLLRDVSGRPAPFASVRRLTGAMPQMLHVPWTIAADSAGRLLLPAVPTGEPYVIKDLAGEALAPGRELTEVVVEARPPLLVTSPVSLRRVQVGAHGSTWEWGQPRATLIPVGAGDVVATTVHGIALTVAEADWPPRSSPLAAVRLDLEVPTAAFDLHVSGIAAADDRLSLWPLSADGRLRWEVGQTRAVRGADGRWRWLMPEDATLPCAVIHPDACAQLVELSPAQQRGQQPIAVELHPGSEVTVVLPHGASNALVLEPVDAPAPLASADLRLPMQLRRGRLVGTLPFALPRGAWLARTEPAPSVPARRAEFTVDGSAPATVTVSGQ